MKISEKYIKEAIFYDKLKNMLVLQFKKFKSLKSKEQPELDNQIKF